MEKTICPRCSKNPKKSNFGYCDPCQKEYMAKYRQNNKDTLYTKKNEKRRKWPDGKPNAKLYLGEYLKSHPCVDCGESDPLVLELHHLNRDEKRLSIGAMKSYSLENVQSEIAKCVMLCANCHARRTAKECNSWRLYL